LWTYAVAGALLFFFYKLEAKMNLIIGILLLSVISVFILLGSLLLFVSGQEMNGYIFELGMTDAILNGTYSDIVEMNITLLGISFSGIIFVVPIVLAMFLIGLYFGQRKIFNNIDDNLSLFKKLAAFGLGLGLPIKILTGYWTTYAGGDVLYSTLGQLSSSLGGPLMALGYISLLVLLMKKYKAIVKILQPVGQIVLTNDIGQTFIMFLVLFIANLVNSVDAIYFVPIVVLVFALLIGLSKVWMSNFAFGPLEWIGRRLT